MMLWYPDMTITSKMGQSFSIDRRIRQYAFSINTESAKSEKMQLMSGNSKNVITDDSRIISEYDSRVAFSSSSQTL